MRPRGSAHRPWHAVPRRLKRGRAEGALGLADRTHVESVGVLVAGSRCRRGRRGPRKRCCGRATAHRVRRGCPGRTRAACALPPAGPGATGRPRGAGGSGRPLAVSTGRGDRVGLQRLFEDVGALLVAFELAKRFTERGQGIGAPCHRALAIERPCQRRAIEADAGRVVSGAVGLVGSLSHRERAVVDRDERPGQGTHQPHRGERDRGTNSAWPGVDSRGGPPRTIKAPDGDARVPGPASAGARRAPGNPAPVRRRSARRESVPLSVDAPFELRNQRLEGLDEARPANRTQIAGTTFANRLSTASRFQIALCHRSVPSYRPPNANRALRPSHSASHFMLTRTSTSRSGPPRQSRPHPADRRRTVPGPGTADGPR